MCCLKGYVSGWIAKLVSGCLHWPTMGCIPFIDSPFLLIEYRIFIGSCSPLLVSISISVSLATSLFASQVLFVREKSDLSDSSSLDFIVVYPRGMFLMYVFACPYRLDVEAVFSFAPTGQSHAIFWGAELHCLNLWKAPPCSLFGFIRITMV